MSEMAPRIQDLSPERRELLELLLKENRAKQAAAPAEAAELPTLTPAPEQRYEPFPLRDIQQAYWVGRSGTFYMGNVGCHAYAEFESTDLDVERLARAWRRLIDRHDMLRTIVLADGRQQTLAQVPPYEIKVLDLSGQPADQVEAQLAQIRQRLSHQVLSPDRWPMFEICATRLNNQRTRIHLSVDSMIADGGSFRLLTHELDYLYQNPGSSLVPLEITFRDYLLGELALQESEAYKHSLEYWRKRLETLPPAPDLPLAKSPSSILQPHFVRRQGGLPVEAWRRLKQRAQQINLTPSAVLLAAYAEVLACWSASPRLTINVPEFNRLPLHPQINRIVGEFASFSLIEVDRSKGDSFRTHARYVQEQLWEAMNHRHVSGVRVLREMARLRGEAPEGASMPVVYTSMLVLDTLSLDATRLALFGNQIFGINQTPQVWMDLQLVEQDGELEYSWEAVEDLFPAGMMDDMFNAYRQLVQRLADDDAAWAESARPALPAAQSKRLEAMRDNAAPIPGKLLQELFADQAAQRPGDPAVVTSDRTLTYDQLYRSSIRVGRRLRALGARPNTLVAVVMEKGWEQIVAVMGIVQSGAAYLPIDAEVPPQRLKYLLENGEVKIVLTQSRLDTRLAWPEGVQHLAIDDESAWDVSDEPLEPAQSQDDLLYVIYTSGSTGMPKGAMIAQRGMINAVVQTNECFRIGPRDRVLALTALHHDMSAYDIFGILTAGGTIVMPDASGRLDPAHWAARIAHERVTLWNSVPAMMEMLVEHVAARGEALPPSLRLAFLGGDWIPVTLPDRLAALAPNARVVSVGGPTETTLWNIWYPVEKVLPEWKSIPYGRPIANTRYYILNEALDECPDWVPGEMCCAGVGVAKGYWRDEDKTRERFILHPRTGERLYRTGDRGRRLPDGNIEFVGRVDLQIKITGHRIEPGEIEAALCQHPSVRSAAVTAVADTGGHKRLVAYIVPDEAPQPAVGQLNELLQSADQRQLEGVLTDPVARLEFKLKHVNIRQDDDKQLIKLKAPDMDEAWMDRYVARRSYRTFTPAAIPFDRFSEFLSCLAQMEMEGLPFPKYQYGSGGGLYPVQTYVQVKAGRVQGLPGGSYYYHPQQHGLVLLSSEDGTNPDLHMFTNRTIFDESAFSIFLVAQLEAMTPMYGAEKAKFYSAIEAGLIAQLLEMSAPAFGLGLCQIGSLYFDQIRHLFNLGDNHLYLHCLIGGPIDTNLDKRQALVRDWSAFHALPLERKSGDDLVTSLRQFLEDRLPRHMVPADYVMLEAMPLSPNGKIDRKALPSLQTAEPSAAKGFEPPSTPIQQALASIWSDILRVDPVGIHDNFFELGGDSLRAVRLSTRVSEAFQIEFTLRQLFKAVTIAELAKVVESSLVREMSELSDDEAQRLLEKGA